MSWTCPHCGVSMKASRRRIHERARMACRANRHNGKLQASLWVARNEATRGGDEHGGSGFTRGSGENIGDSGLARGSDEHDGNGATHGSGEHGGSGQRERANDAEWKLLALLSVPGDAPPVTNIDVRSCLKEYNTRQIDDAIESLRLRGLVWMVPTGEEGVSKLWLSTPEETARFLASDEGRAHAEESDGAGGSADGSKGLQALAGDDWLGGDNWWDGDNWGNDGFGDEQPTQDEQHAVTCRCIDVSEFSIAAPVLTHADEEWADVVIGGLLGDLCFKHGVSRAVIDRICRTLQNGYIQKAIGDERLTIRNSNDVINIVRSTIPSQSCMTVHNVPTLNTSALYEVHGLEFFPMRMRSLESVIAQLADQFWEDLRWQPADGSTNAIAHEIVDAQWWRDESATADGAYQTLGLMFAQDAAKFADAGNLSAKPVLVSLANLPAALRRSRDDAWPVLAYVPSLEEVLAIGDEVVCTSLRRELLQSALAYLWREAKALATNGVVLKHPSKGERVVCRLRLVAALIDYEEAWRIACCLQGSSCVACLARKHDWVLLYRVECSSTSLEAEVAAALDEYLKQGRGIRIVVVDDANTENTPESLRDRVAKMTRRIREGEVHERIVVRFRWVQVKEKKVAQAKRADETVGGASKSQNLRKRMVQLVVMPSSPRLPEYPPRTREHIARVHEVAMEKFTLALDQARSTGCSIAKQWKKAAAAATKVYATGGYSGRTAMLDVWPVADDLFTVLGLPDELHNDLIGELKHLKAAFIARLDESLGSATEAKRVCKAIDAFVRSQPTPPSTTRAPAGSMSSDNHTGGERRMALRRFPTAVCCAIMRYGDDDTRVLEDFGVACTFMLNMHAARRGGIAHDVLAAATIVYVVHVEILFALWQDSEFAYIKVRPQARGQHAGRYAPSPHSSG